MGDPRARVILESVRQGDAAFASFTKDLEHIAVKAELLAEVIKEVVRGGAEYVKSTFEQIDAEAKRADALGISTKAYGGLTYAARLADVDVEVLNKALVRQSKTIYDASQGVKAAKDALGSLNLDYQTLEKLSPDKQFLTIAEALRNVGNTTERAALMQEIFGGRNAALATLVLTSAASFREASDEAERFGTAVDRIEAAKIELADDAIKRVKERIRGLANIVAEEVAGDIAALANALADVGGKADDMRVAVRNALNRVETGVGLVLDAFYGWKLILVEIKELSASAAAAEIRDLVRLQQVAIDTASLVLRAYGNPGAANLGVNPLGAELANNLQAAAKAAQDELAAMIASGAPSAKLAENVGRARAEQEALAKEIAATAQNRIDKSGNTPIDTSRADEAARLKAQREYDAALRGVQQVNEAIRAGLQQEFNVRAQYGDLSVAQAKELAARIVVADEDVQKNKLAHELAQLRDGLEKKILTEEEFHQKSIEAAEAAAAANLAIEKRSHDAVIALQNKKIASVLSLTSAIADALTAGGESSKKQFEQNKKISIAAAIIDTIGAALVTLRTGGPFPANVIAAAAVAAAGYAQVARIRATSWSGDSGGSSGISASVGSSSGASGSVPSTAAPPALSGSRSGTNIYLTVQGSVIGEGGRTQLAEDLVKLLRDHVDRTDDTLVTVTSRNGMDLSAQPA